MTHCEWEVITKKEPGFKTRFKLQGVGAKMIGFRVQGLGFRAISSKVLRVLSHTLGGPPTQPSNSD